MITRCTKCHGASPIVGGHGEDSWARTLEEMSEIARDSGRPDPVGANFALLEGYLSRVLPREDGGRGRGRGRGGDDDD